MADSSLDRLSDVNDDVKRKQLISADSPSYTDVELQLISTKIKKCPNQMQNK